MDKELFDIKRQMSKHIIRSKTYMPFEDGQLPTRNRPVYRLVHESVYTYNQHGDIVYLENYYHGLALDNSFDAYDNEYDEQGRLIKVYDKINKEVYVEQYYSEVDRITIVECKICRQIGEGLDHHIIRKYDTVGREIEWYDKDMHFIKEYDEQSRLIKSYRVYQNGIVELSSEYLYKDSEDPYLCISYMDGERRNATRHEYEYNANGDWIERRDYIGDSMYAAIKEVREIKYTMEES